MFKSVFQANGLKNKSVSARDYGRTSRCHHDVDIAFSETMGSGIVWNCFSSMDKLDLIHVRRTFRREKHFDLHHVGNAVETVLESVFGLRLVERQRDFVGLGLL